MTDHHPIPLAPYKHTEWPVGTLQTPIQVQFSPATLAQIGKLIAESIEEQHPALNVCVVNVPMLTVSASVVGKKESP